MSNRMMPVRIRRRVLWAGVGGALAVIAAVASAAAASTDSSAAAATAPVKLSSAPLGINVAPWDALYAASGSASILQAKLKAAGVDQVRFGGGQTADYYDWQTDTDIQKCLGDPVQSAFTNPECETKDAVDFSLFSTRARAIGAQSFVTVNYGSGTPAEAVAWVKKAKSTSADAVGLWEVGNENYGCWEVNNELATAPEDYQGYVVNTNPVCPMVAEGLTAGMQTMAESYAVHAAQFMTAMKAANPSAEIGVPWAFDSSVGGAAVGDYTDWDNIVLKADAKDIGFVDAHYYPMSFGGSTGGVNPTDQQVLQSLYGIPAQYGNIRSVLNRYDPSAKIVVGETGVTYLATTIPCTPVGALFAAGDALSWLSSGAQSVDWWQLNSYGNMGTTCKSPDEGMFTSSARPVAETPYIGYLLASALARPSARLSRLTTSEPANVLAYQSVLPNGQVAVVFINTSTSTAEHVTFKTSLSGKLTKVVYSAGNQNSANTKSVTTSTTAATVAKGLTLPRESITLFKVS